MEIKAMLKVVLIILGTLSLAIGCIGILVPGLPTTPFVLLTAALYIRSSDKLYRMVHESKLFGRMIRDYKEGGGITIARKIYIITLMSAMVAIAVIFFVRNSIADWIVIAAGIAGAVVVGFIVPTAGNDV